MTKCLTSSSCKYFAVKVFARRNNQVARQQYLRVSIACKRHCLASQESKQVLACLM
jgi:hypothetical protein